MLGDLLSGRGRAAHPGADAADVPGHAAAVPGARSVLAALPGAARTGRHPGRRHGPGQDRTDAVAAAGRARRLRRTRCRPTLLVCPMSLVSNWQKEAARFAPGLRVYVHHGGTRLRDDEFLAAVADADLVLTTYGTALRDLGALRDIALGPGGLRRGAGDQEQRHPAGTGGAGHPGAHPAGADRHAGGEPPGRALVHHGVLQPGPARPGQAVPAAVPGADRGPPGRGRRRGAQAGHRTVRAAPPQDRQVDHLGPAGEERDEGLVHAHRRAGDALPGRGRGHDGRRSRTARASSGGATCSPR